MTRPRFTFSHRGADGRLYWVRRIPFDSRIEQISCDAAWFWRDQPGAAS